MALLPALDMAMDMSSPAQRMDHDSDIEIDFGDYAVGIELTDDEQMLEDGEQARPDTANDEHMVDDEQVVATHEEVMTDELPPAQTLAADEYDDDLIDYEDEAEIQEAIVAPEIEVQGQEERNVVPPEEVPTASTLQEHPVSAVTQEVQEIVATETDPETAPAESTAPDAGLVATVETSDAATITPGIPSKASAKPAEEESSALAEPAIDARPADSAWDVDEAEPKSATVEHVEHAEIANDKLTGTALSTLNTDSHTFQDVPPTPTDTGLHPVMVNYRDVEFPLFKSKSAPNGLLEDDNLASLSLSELMAKCKEQLAINTGEKVSDDQRLCLFFEHMRSSLREHDPRAFEFSLKEILDIFILLHENDGVDEVPPMWVAIELTWDFSKLVRDMKSAASEGYGMSNFAFIKNANEDYYQDDDVEQVSEEEEEALVGEEEHYDEAEASYAEDSGEQTASHGEPQHQIPISNNEALEASEPEQEHLESVAQDETNEVGAHVGDPLENAVNDTTNQVSGDNDADANQSLHKSPREPSRSEHLPPKASEGSSAVPSPGSSVTLAATQEAANADGTDGGVAESSFASNHSDAVPVENEEEHHERPEVEAPAGSRISELHEGDEDEEGLAKSQADEEEAEGDATAQAALNDEKDNLADTEGVSEQARDGEDHDETTYHSTYEFADPDEEPETAQEAQPEDSLEPLGEAETNQVEESISQMTATAEAEDDLLEYGDDEATYEGDDSYEYIPIGDPAGGYTYEGIANFEEDEDHGAEENTEQVEVPAPSRSPNGKRRLEASQDFDSIDFADEEPDSKKARAG